MVLCRVNFASGATKVGCPVSSPKPHKKVVIWFGMPVTRPCYDIASCESLFSSDVVQFHPESSSFPPFILSLLSLVNIRKNKTKYIYVKLEREKFNINF